jgi:hypothetical protein
MFPAISFAVNNHPSSSIIINWSMKGSAPKQLNSKQVDRDISFLMQVLDKAYVGKQFLPSGKYYTLLSGLSVIKGSYSREHLKDVIDEVLLSVPDGHLKAMTYAPSKKRMQRYRLLQSKKPSKIKNWHIKKYTVRGQRILDINIKLFPDSKSKSWRQLISKLKSLLAQTDVVIMDLRDSPGGNSLAGQKLVEALTGRENQSAIIKEVHVQTPWALGLMINMLTQNKWNVELSKKPVSQYLKNHITEAKRLYQESLHTNLVKPWGVIEDSVRHRSKVKVANKAYHGPIVLLQGSACRSACELFVKTMKMFPNTIGVGQSTSGILHFGNAGPLILPYSRIMVMIPTVYLELYDREFIEGRGVKPDVTLSLNKDAHKYAIHRIEWFKAKFTQ